MEAQKNSAAAPEGTAASRYTGLTYQREPFLIRARRQSRLTIPSLFREKGENETTTYALPWQSMGAQGVNNLSAKLVMALFPSGIPFIQLKQSKESKRSLAQMDPDSRGKLSAEIDKGLSGVEQEFIDGVGEDGDAITLYDAARHLIVGGNHCIRVMPDASLRGYPLEEYVTLRDGSGNLIEFCIEEPMAWETLPPEIKAMALGKGYQIKNSSYTQAPVQVYTHGCLKDGSWKVYQECYGEKVDGSDWTYTPEAMPFIFLRMVALKHENYGRSYCEDYEADLQGLDGFWQIITEGSAAVAILKWLVKSGGTTNKKQFAELPNGGVMTGDPEEVSAVRSEHEGDLKVAYDLATRLEQRLQRVFIMDSAVQRDGERVTAEEIRLMVRALEATLGGVYSNQVTTWQLPYAQRKMAALQRLGRVTKLPKGATKMTILTGDAALGRQQKAQTLNEFLQTATAAIGTASALSPYINIETYLNRSAANMAIDTDGLIKSEEEVQQAQQAAQQAEMAKQVAPEVVKQGGGMVQNLQQAHLQQQTPAAAPQAAQQ